MSTRECPLARLTHGVPTPDQIRPIDVFSVILRIQATALVRALKPWVMRIQHPAQHALSGGVVLACSRIAWTTECAEVGLTQVWGLSIDFAKMFNSLSPHVAAAVARCMGLSLDNIRDLVLPILKARGVWRLPNNCEPEIFVNSRGLPQGMASSVLLAEVAISPLLWRLSLHDPSLCMWSYVDDLNLCVESVPKLLEALDLHSGICCGLLVVHCTSQVFCLDQLKETMG